MELGVSLVMWWETQGFFQAAMGTSGFLLNCDRELGIHLMLLEGNQASSKWRWENRGYCQVLVGNADFLSRCDGDLGVPFRLQQGRQASSRVEIGNLGFLSICHREVWPLSSCRGKLGFLSSSSRGIGPPLELLQETWPSSQEVMGISGL